MDFIEERYFKLESNILTNDHNHHFIFELPEIIESPNLNESQTTEQGSDTVATINYIVNVYVDSILCLFGFVGNSLAIFVLQKDKCKNSNNCLLQALAVYDTLLLIFTVLYTVLRSIYPATGELQDYYNIGPYIIAIGLPIGWIAQTGTIWFTTLVAADRYVAISFPFKAIRWCTHIIAVKVTLLVSAAAVLFNIPRFFHYVLVGKHLANANDTLTFVSHIKIDLPGWNSTVYHYLYHIGLTLIFLYIIPVTFLIFFNTKLIRALRNAKKTQRRLSNVNTGAYKHNSSATLNMVVVITKFILCQTPDFIAAIVGALPIAIDSDIYSIFLIFKEMLLVFNSSVNFYIYLIFNAKFRKIMSRSCCCCICKGSTHKGSTHLLSYYHTKSTRTAKNSLSVHPIDNHSVSNWLPSLVMKSELQKGHINPVLEVDDTDSGIFGSRDINMSPDADRKVY